MRWCAIVAAVLVLPGFALAEEKGDRPPSYVKDVKPIFEANCVRCHKGSKPKGGFDMTSVEAMLRGGKKGKTMLSPGKPEKSPLVLTMEGKGKVMPPRKEKQKPTADEVALVRRWISAGAKDDSKTEE